MLIFHYNGGHGPFSFLKERVGKFVSEYIYASFLLSLVLQILAFFPVHVHYVHVHVHVQNL